MLKAIALAALIAGVPAAAAANDVTGVWQTRSLQARIEIAPCGDAVCGRLLSALPASDNPQLLDVHNKDPALRNRRVVGATLIEGFRGGPVKWIGGRVYNPGDGHYYRGSMTLLSPNRLKLTGCALRILCKSQTWTRIR